MKRTWGRTVDWWQGLGSSQRRTINAMTLIVALYIAHYMVFTWAQPFYIEDAGISFAYARNFAEGHGFVTFPGGERVEGYSNPLWTFIIAFLYFVKVPVWVSSKMLGMVFGAVALPFVWALCRRARGGRDDAINLVPPFLLACSTQYAVWNGSGLENSLFCVLMATSMYRTVKEGMDGGKPLSALLYFCLAITRPEGVAYVAVGFVARLLFAVATPSPLSLGTVIRKIILPMLAWILTFAIPFGLYHWWHFSYFAWPFPNTYYAKMGEGNRFKPLIWDNKGWKYLNNYLTTYWLAFISPVFFFAPGGLRRWRGAITIFLVAIFGVLVLWNGTAPYLDDLSPWQVVKSHWIEARVLWIFGSAFVVGLLAFRRPGWQALTIIWATFCATVMYVLYTGGDWMVSFRWGNMLSVPLFLVVGIGLGEIVDLIPGIGKVIKNRLPVRPLVVAGLAIAIAAPNVWGSSKFVAKPETGVRDVKRRVDYMTWIQKRLHLDHVVLYDVDMGAHMYYSGWDIVDVAGLVDVPFGHHKYEKEFVREYVYKERRPDFLHSHGGWQRKTKANTFPEYKDYFEIPGYPSGGRTLHVGNHVAKRHWVTNTYEGTKGRQVPFTGAITLHGWDIPSEIVPVGGKFFIQTWFSVDHRKEGFRALVFVTDTHGHTFVRETAPGYDWYAPSEWKKGEIIFTGFDLGIPEDLPEGDYRVGLVLLDESTGVVLAPFPPPDESVPTEAEEEGTEDAVADDEADEEDRTVVDPSYLAPVVISGGKPVFMSGEYLLPNFILKVRSRAVAAEEAENDRDTAIAFAGQGSCEAAWESWRDARRHLIRNTKWQDENEAPVISAITECYVVRSENLAEPTEKAIPLILARDHFDFDNPHLLAVARPLAAWFQEDGDNKQAEEDWEGCYKAYATAVALDGRLSMARRQAEICRDQHLNIKSMDERSFWDSFQEAMKGSSKPVKKPATKTASPPKGKATPPRATLKPIPGNPLKGKAEPTEEPKPDEAPAPDAE